MYTLTSNPQEYNEVKIKCLEEYIEVCEDDIRAYQTLVPFMNITEDLIPQ